MAAEQKKAPLLKVQEDFDKQCAGFLVVNENLHLVLDYEGTLAPISEQLAPMPKDTELAIKKLAANDKIWMCIMSGRGLDEIKNHLKLPNVTYAANNGLEVEYPDKSKFSIEMPQALLDKYGKLLEELKEKCVVSGAWVEDKKIALTYHYKGVNEKLRAKLIEDAKGLIKSHGFQIIEAHYALEAKPPLNWDKGEAVKMILEKKFTDDWAKNLKIIYAGDDITDEDSMKLLKTVKSGKTFRVSEQPNLKTYGDFQLKTPNEVSLMLKWVQQNYPVKK